MWSGKRLLPSSLHQYGGTLLLFSIGFFLSALLLLSLFLAAPPEKLIVGHEAFTLETARTPEERMRGLSGRDSLCPTCAMLFEFPSPGRYAFHMQGMRFPLDIVWLSGGRVVWIEPQPLAELAGNL